MKKELLLSIFIILCSTLFSFGKAPNHYIPIVVEGNRWYEFSYVGLDTKFYGTTILKIEGDTVIDDVIYKKLLYTKSESNNAAWKLKAVVREDVSRRKVYVRMYDDKFGLLPESLLYDFLVSVGDVVKITNYTAIFDDISSMDFEMTVNSIEKVIINGIERNVYDVDIKRAGTRNGDSRKIIEGIGFASDAFFYCPLVMGGGYALACFFQEDILVYKNPEHKKEDCFVTTEDYTFPSSDAIWVIQIRDNKSFKEGQSVQYVAYGLSGDTLINNTAYSKLYLLNDTTLNIDNKDIYVAGIRVKGKQVWIKPADKKDGTVLGEYLLYDLLLEKGDAFKIKNFPIIDYTSHTKSFDDINRFIEAEFELSDWGQGDQYRYMLTTFSIQSQIINVWYEFVGSKSGLFHYNYIQTLDRGMIGGTLQCMKYRDKVEYLFNCKTCFQNFNYTGIETNKSNTADVYYNIETDCVVINSESLCRLYLYDLNGQVRRTAAVTTVNSDVDVSSLSKGVYIYKLEGDNLNQRGKLIIH